MSESDGLPGGIAALNRQLERLAEAGEWEEVGRLLPERDARLGQLSAAGRESVLEEARRSTARLLALARAAHAECRAEILSLRQGRAGAGSYVTIREESR